MSWVDHTNYLYNSFVWNSEPIISQKKKVGEKPMYFITKLCLHFMWQTSINNLKFNLLYLGKHCNRKKLGCLAECALDGSNNVKRRWYSTDHEKSVLLFTVYVTESSIHSKWQINNYLNGHSYTFCRVYKDIN